MGRSLIIHDSGPQGLFWPTGAVFWSQGLYSGPQGCILAHKGEIGSSQRALDALPAPPRPVGRPRPSQARSSKPFMDATWTSGVWRSGSASDSRSEGWEFESLCPHFSRTRFSCESLWTLSTCWDALRQYFPRLRTVAKMVVFDTVPKPPKFCTPLD